MKLTLLHTTIEKLFRLAVSSFTAHHQIGNNINASRQLRENAVSYTHLDVYKRQDYNYTMNDTGIRRWDRRVWNGNKCRGNESDENNNEKYIRVEILNRRTEQVYRYIYLLRSGPGNKRPEVKQPKRRKRSIGERYFVQRNETVPEEQTNGTFYSVD